MSIPWNPRLISTPEVLQFAVEMGDVSTREALVMILELWDLFTQMADGSGRIRGTDYGALTAMIPDTPDSFWDTLERLSWVIEDGNDVAVPLYDPNLYRWLMRRREAMKAFRPQPSVARGLHNSQAV